MTAKKKFNPGLNEFIALISLLGILLFLILRFLIPSLKGYANYPLYVVLISAIPLIFLLLRNLFRLEFGSDLIAGIAIITAVILSQYLAGSLVVLMLSGGQSLERYAIRKASRVLELLAKRAPTIAHRKQKVHIEDISIDKIRIGDEILIFPHEICPVDGEVISGKGTMDESYLTGEPFLLSKAPGSLVLSGSINGDVALTIKANKLAIDSRYAKIMKVMEESEQKKPKIRRLADELGAWYTPLAIIIALLAWILSHEAIRFLAVLVIATPCPLLIAIPVAIIGSISLSARRGIFVKNPVVLEQLDQCRTMIFDKTGTLTYGKPDLSEQLMFNQNKKETVLQLAASIERYSKHPLAQAILDKAYEENLALLDVQYISEPKGQGLVGKIGENEIHLTNRKQYRGKEALPEGIGLECLIIIDGKLAAYYRFRDLPRKESGLFIKHLFPKHHFKKTVILSGDREEEVKYLADTLGIKEIYANKSPEEKVSIVMEENRKAKTVFLGDGINDAPALMVATVGIALGQNSDITAEAAGAVVMDNSFLTVDEFLHISRRMRVIALQSAIGGISLSLLGMIFAAFGYLPPVAGAITQEIIDVLAILNSLRTAWSKNHLTDVK